MEKRYPVLFKYHDGTERLVSAQGQADTGNWNSILQTAHGIADIFCRCFGRGTKQLANKHRTSRDSNHLARFPNTGPQHANDCLYYVPNKSMSGLQGYVTDVVSETEDGGFSVKLAVGLRKKDPLETAEDVAAHARPNAPGVQKPSMTTLGLLHFLWSVTGFNRWSPAMEGKRNPGLVHAHLLMAAAKIAVGRRINLDEVLLVCAPGKNLQDGNALKVKEAERLKRRLVVIAPLAQHSLALEKGVGALRVAGFTGMPVMMLSEARWVSTKRSFPIDIAAWKDGARVMAIAIIDQPKDGKASVLKLSLMAISAQWIPFASSYEAKIEALLHSQQRRFWKPLRFDAATDQVFPDFWLLDAGGKERPMEVFGLKDQEYLARRQVKETHYNANYGVDGWWYWNAADDPSGKDIPPFPMPAPYNCSPVAP